MRSALTALAAVLALAAAPARAADAPDACELVLVDALGEGRNMDLYLAFGPQGKVDHAFGAARRFNRMPHTVESRTVVRSEGGLAGIVHVTIPFDGYVPKGGQPLEAEITLDVDASGAAPEGRYMGVFGGERRGGKVAGRWIESPGPTVPRRLTLHCERAVYWEAGRVKKNRKGVRLGVEIAVRGGKSYAARLIPAGSITDVGMSAYAGDHELTLEGHVLKGTLTGTVYPQNAAQSAIAYAWTLDGLVIGDRVAGTLSVTENGSPVGTGAYLGEVRAGAPDPRDCLMKLTLAEAVPPHNFMNVFLSVAGGQVLHGFATTPSFNNAIHEVRPEALELAGEALRGRLGVTIRPDGWVPKDRQPIPCAFEVDAHLLAGEVVGRHEGTFGEKPVKGKIEGALDPKPDVRQLDGLTLKIEDGPFGRGFFTLEYEDGVFKKGRVWNNHSDLTGEIREAALTWQNERLGGHLTAFVEKGGAKRGVYTVRPDGVLVGTMGAGLATTTAEDGREKTATFWISLRPAGAAER